MVVNLMSDERINKIWKLDENGGVSEEYLKELKLIRYQRAEWLNFAAKIRFFFV